MDHTFGVLQSWFIIVRWPARLWKRNSVGRILLAYVVLHNMIVEDEREEATINIDLNDSARTSFVVPPKVNLVLICVLLTCYVCVPTLPYVLTHNILN